MWIAIVVGLVSTLRADPPPPAATFPTPPQQSAPWVLPNGMEDPKGEIKDAVETLFKLGLADPRGCAYRHVTVMEDGKPHRARGWVLPAADEAPRHAIGWNGLIYPIVKIGQSADLEEDVKHLMKTGEFGDVPFSNYQDEGIAKVLSEFAATARMMRAWAAPYLLLRLGHPVVIRAANPNPFDSFDYGKDQVLNFPAEFYLGSDGDWLVTFARLIRGDGVAAFLTKDDALATQRLQAFDAVWTEVVKRLPRESNGKEADPFSDPPPPPSRTALNSAYRAMLVDAQRRLGPRPDIESSVIAREIASWDQLDSWNEEAPSAGFESVVAAGSSAIGPLLDCLEKDARWTRVRCGYDGRNDEPTRILRVKDIAISALNRVLRYPAISVEYSYVQLEDPWYANTAAQTRELCRKYESACGAELWFRILQDDDADLGWQLTAGELIVRPDGREASNESYDFFYVPTARERFDSPMPSKEGKLLRSRHDPSVLDLLKRAWRRARLRADADIANGEPEARSPVMCGETPRVRRGAANHFVRLMEEWQPGNVDVLKEHYDWLSSALFNVKKDDQPATFMISALCEETLIRRFWSNDKTAMADYEKLFRFRLASGEAPIQVMTTVPDEEGMDQLAQLAFIGDKAPLGLANKPWTLYDFREQLIEVISSDSQPSPLLELPSFRRALIDALKSPAKRATLTITKDGASMTYLAGKNDDSPPLAINVAVASLGANHALLCKDAVGTTTDVRLCDLIAYLLTPKRGPGIWVSPSFHLDDPLPKRDQAITEWIKVLSQARS